MSRFKVREKQISDDAGNTVTIRALSAGERMEMSRLGGGTDEDRARLPLFLFATACTSHNMSEEEVRKEVPTDLLDRACSQIMEWARPQLEKKGSTPESSSSAASASS